MNQIKYQKQRLPDFSRINPGRIENDLDQLLQENREILCSLLKGDKNYSWENLLEPVEDMQDSLQRFWSPISHLHAVADNDELRKAYNKCLPKLTDYNTELGQNEELFRAYQQVANGHEFASLDQSQKKIIEYALRDFRLSGVGLDKADKKEYQIIRQELSKYETKFEENLLDATHAWSKHITNESQLSGLPPSALALAAQNAKSENKPGWLFTLDFPSYLPVMQYADDQSLRREMYEAYVTRASDQGPNAGKWDNSEAMVKILSLRSRLARLLGFKNYAEYSLERKMASTTEEVHSFLRDLARRSKPVAERELAELKEFARETDNVNDLNAWDIAYYAEKLRQSKYEFSQEELRPYFPLPQVLSGLFSVVNRLYGMKVREKSGIAAWHKDVRFFEIYDETDRLRGSFYLDPYARAHKRGGAWMDECIVRKYHHNSLQYPVAYLNCNFSPPVNGEPSLLTHDEVTTLFHEFGHGLHHMLTLVNHPGVAGINGVPWDAVELPSQFMENWCWERESLDLIAKHFKTGDLLPDELHQKMLRARNFESGMQMVRQLEFALFDFRLHSITGPLGITDIQATLDQVRTEVAVLQPPSYNRFQHGFSHIFSGGYAAGYYSYKWAEVLSADAFSKFEQNGIFDRTTGSQFLHTFLEQGGTRDPMDLFIEFRGRKPSIEPLLRHSGILPDTAGAMV